MTKTLALTIGDPTGIGPEITVKALQRIGEFADTKFIVIGSCDAMARAATALDMKLPINDRVSYIAIEDEKPGTVAYNAIESAVHLVREKKADAIVTGPISKKNLITAGYDYHGHTEILEALAQSVFGEKDARAEMLFAYKNFRLLLLTRHIPLRDVPAALAKSGAVARPIKTLIKFLRHQAGIFTPKIALLGLNPHAGEISGEEEQKLFSPVIHAVNGVGASELSGPFAADAFFRGFNAEAPQHDAIVAAYHDQGLIPFKMSAGYEAVNITIGLPFLRTSVSHGTAEDIVGQNIAREDSLLAAIRSALSLSAA